MISSNFRQVDVHAAEDDRDNLETIVKPRADDPSATTAADDAEREEEGPYDWIMNLQQQQQQLQKQTSKYA